MSAGARDQSLPGILELDRVWITVDGRAKLLDFSAPGTGARLDQPAGEPAPGVPATGGGSSPQLFLNQVVVAALEGHPVAAAVARPASVAAPLPLHAQDLLLKLQAGLSPSLLADQLRPLLNKLAVVSLRRRLAVLAACNAFPLGAAAICAALGLALARSAQTHPEATALGQSLAQLSALKNIQNLPGGLDGIGAAYSANLLSPVLTWNGTPFNFGPTNAADVVSAVGQTIILPAGRFSNLAMLATAVQGGQTSQVLTVTYEDNRSSKWVQSFSDWFIPRNNPRESNALAMAHRDLANGTQDRRTFHLYGYTFPLDSSRRVRSLTLPTNANLEVLALTLEPPATTVNLSTAFNRANGIVADGSTFSEEAHAREAFEVYIAGRFRQTITNPATWTSLAGTLIPQDQRTAAQQLIGTRPAPTDSELRQAAGVVEPYLQRMWPEGLVTPLAIFSKPRFLVVVSAWTLLMFCALPSLVAAVLFRGGLVLRMLGLAVVKKDGARASRLRIFWRSVIAWSPALLSITLMEPQLHVFGAFSGERAVAISLALILAVSLVVWAALLPERGLQDRLAGTCLVPRE
jgi:hypothetical protein